MLFYSIPVWSVHLAGVTRDTRVKLLLCCGKEEGAMGEV